MSTDELVTRQQRLLVRNAQLRLILADQAQVLKGPLAVADQARSGFRWLYNNPRWPLAAMLVLLAVRPRRMVLWGGRLWLAWSTFKRLQSRLATTPRPGHRP